MHFAPEVPILHPDFLAFQIPNFQMFLFIRSFSPCLYTSLLPTKIMLRNVFFFCFFLMISLEIVTPSSIVSFTCLLIYPDLVSLVVVFVLLLAPRFYSSGVLYPFTKRKLFSFYTLTFC